MSPDDLLLKRSNGSLLGELPLAVRVFVLVGFPAAVAIVLLWFVISIVWADLGTIKDQHEFIQQQHNNIEQNMYGTCINTARESRDISRCTPPALHPR